MEFFNAIKPPYVVAEVNDAMMMEATGTMAGKFFQQASGGTHAWGIGVGLA